MTRREPKVAPPSLSVGLLHLRAWQLGHKPKLWPRPDGPILVAICAPSPAAQVKVCATATLPLRRQDACTFRASSGMLHLLEWPHRARSAVVRRPNRYARGSCIGSLTRSGIDCACAAGAGLIGSSAEAERVTARARGSHRKNNPPRLSRRQPRRRRPRLRLRPPRPNRVHPKSSRARGPTLALVAAAKITEGRGGAGSSVAKAARRCCAAGVATTVSPCPAIRGPLVEDLEGTPNLKIATEPPPS